MRKSWADSNHAFTSNLLLIKVKPANIFQQKFDSRQAQYDNKTARQKYSNSSKIQSYYNAIWVCLKRTRLVII